MMVQNENNLVADNTWKTVAYLFIGDNKCASRFTQLRQSYANLGYQPLALGLAAGPVCDEAGQPVWPDVTLYTLEAAPVAPQTRLVIGGPLSAVLKRDPRLHRLIERILTGGGFLTCLPDVLAFLYTIGLGHVLRTESARVEIKLPPPVAIPWPPFVTRTVLPARYSSTIG